MDETSLTVWTGITQREGARKQMAGHRAPRNEAPALALSTDFAKWVLARRPNDSIGPALAVVFSYVDCCILAEDQR